MADPYVYENTNILKNKLNMKNQKRLDQYEALVFRLSFEKLRQKSFNVTQSLDILKLHEILFGEVYDWAGNIRIINIEKQEKVLNGLSVIYADKKRIKKELLNLNKQILNLRYDNFFIKNISRIIANLWQIHPFREGNTRTVVVFLYFYLKNFNLEINFELLEIYSKFFRNALVLASIGEYSEFKHLEKILTDAILGPENKINEEVKSNEKYSKINDLDLSKYKYNYHTKKD